MKRPRTYLDWNATAPLRPEAREAMIAALDATGNPSSVHAEGRQARSLIEAARDQVAALVGADARDVYFTSGASEANNWVLRSGFDTVLRAGSEHDSVLSAAEISGARVVALPVARNGVVAVEAIADATLGGAAPLGRALVALQFANNETGVIQPVAEVVEFAQGHGLHVLCDAVQAAGRTHLDVRALGADYVTLSAHKLGGPKGIGALVAQPGSPLSPLILGGGQERRQRAGTENVAAIAGFGAAAVAAGHELAASAIRVEALRAWLETELRAVTPRMIIVGAGAPRLPNTTCVALPGRLAEVLVAGLDLAGVAVSAGAACSSGKVGRSRVLEAMGCDGPVAAGAIRVSLGPATTEEDIAAFLVAWHAMTAVGRVAA